MLLNLLISSAEDFTMCVNLTRSRPINFGCFTTLLKSGRRSRLLPSDEMALVRMLTDNPGTTKAQACHDRETAGV